MRKSKQTESEFDLTMLTLFQRVELIPENEFDDSMKIAEEVMRSVDIKDAPFLAVGLACKTERIWSEDKDFDKQNLLCSKKMILEWLQNKSHKPNNLFKIEQDTFNTFWTKVAKGYKLCPPASVDKDFFTKIQG